MTTQILTTITKWTETLMLDSFGEGLTDEQFDIAVVAYEAAVRNTYPDAEVDIRIELAVGCPVGINEVELTDGDIEPVSYWNEGFAEAAIHAAIHAV
jgi:hypothetical protein